MNAQTRAKINKLLSLLSVEQKKQDVIKISEKDKTVFDFLEVQGNLHVQYSVEYEDPRLPAESEGEIFLWHKSVNGDWSIYLYQINRMLNSKWKE